jgi:hypothetical protein
LNPQTYVSGSSETERAPRIRIAPLLVEEQTAVSIAACRDQWRAAFRLVYEAYVGAGLAKPNVYRMRVTPYQLLPTTEIFVAARQQQVVATMSLVRDGELGLPMEAVYAEEVEGLRDAGFRLAEVSCLADRRQTDERSPATAMRLMSLMAQCAEQRGVDRLLIAVHPRHARFYQRFTAFEPIGGLKSYHAVCDRPAVAMALALDRVSAEHPEIHRKFFGVPFPDDVLAYCEMPDDVRLEFEPVVEASYDATTYSELAMAG